MGNKTRKEKIQRGLYDSSWSISMTAMVIVAALEVFMMIYTLLNPALYGPYIWRYRSFYIALLAVAVAYMALNVYVRRDPERRVPWMNLANPLCAILFFAWSLGITYSDVTVTGAFDATVFMTFSLVVPLSFYMATGVYAAIAAVIDILMILIILKASGSVGPIINVSIFIVFQIVLGISYLRLKMNVAERIVEEQENALLDVLTGCPNRRAYEDEIKGIIEAGAPADLAYIAIDMNGLKEVNDRQGHAKGDQLIVGAAQCIEKSFGRNGKIFRIGGDEFAVLIPAKREALEGLLAAYEQNVKTWSEAHGLPLSTSHGVALCAEHPDKPVVEIARLADERMYQAKAEYYRASGRDRRKYH